MKTEREKEKERIRALVIACLVLQFCVALFLMIASPICLRIFYAEPAEEALEQGYFQAREINYNDFPLVTGEQFKSELQDSKSNKIFSEKDFLKAYLAEIDREVARVVTRESKGEIRKSKPSVNREKTSKDEKVEQTGKKDANNPFNKPAAKSETLPKKSNVAPSSGSVAAPSAPIQYDTVKSKITVEFIKSAIKDSVAYKLKDKHLVLRGINSKDDLHFVLRGDNIYMTHNKDKSYLLQPNEEFASFVEASE